MSFLLQPLCSLLPTSTNDCPTVLVGSCSCCLARHLLLAGIDCSCRWMRKLVLAFISSCVLCVQALLTASEPYPDSPKAAPVTVVTFGSPNVGDSMWADNFNRKINARQISFEGDVVTKVGLQHTQEWCPASVLDCAVPCCLQCWCRFNIDGSVIGHESVAVQATED